MTKICEMGLRIGASHALADTPLLLPPLRGHQHAPLLFRHDDLFAARAEAANKIGFQVPAREPNALEMQPISALVALDHGCTAASRVVADAASDAFDGVGALARALHVPVERRR